MKKIKEENNNDNLHNLEERLNSMRRDIQNLKERAMKLNESSKKYI